MRLLTSQLCLTVLSHAQMKAAIRTRPTNPFGLTPRSRKKNVRAGCPQTWAPLVVGETPSQRGWGKTMRDTSDQRNDQDIRVMKDMLFAQLFSMEISIDGHLF